MKKFKDFKTALDFLNDYGFEYCYDTVTKKRECYKNEYGEIVLDYKQLDANHWIPQLCIEINQWKNIIDIEKEYIFLGKKRISNFYSMVHYVIETELYCNYKIFGLKINNEFIKNIQIVYTYKYIYNKEYLFEKIKKKSYVNDIQIKIRNENSFLLGLEVTHSGGFWYVANLENTDSGCIIYGQIVHNPDEFGKPRKVEYKAKNKIKDIIFIIIGFILAWWLLLIVWIFGSIYSLFDKKKKNKNNLSKEEKLDKFMIEYLCCEKEG